MTKLKVIDARIYKVLRFTALILLPAAATLYFALASLWGLPKVEETVGTITSVDTFLGVVLRLSTSSHTNFDGDVDIKESPEGKKTYSLNLNSDPNELDSKEFITFKVNAVNSSK